MRIATTTTPLATTTDAIEWLFLDQRGPATAHAGRYEQTTLELWPVDGDGQARLTDGRMSYAHDPGTVERWYESVRWRVLDGVDPDAAMADARRGAAELASALETGLAGLDRYRIAKGARPPRDPDQLDVWVRRASGASERYIGPIDVATHPRAATVAAAPRFAAPIRARFDVLDPSELQQR